MVAAVLPLLTAGCKGIAALGTPPHPLPDVAVVRTAIAGETLLISRYHAVMAAVPGLAASLAPLLGQHQEHQARLRERLIEPTGGPSARPSPGASASGARAIGQVPGTPAAARAYLASAEQAAAQALLARLGPATPSLAQLLASIAASEATHAQLLSPRRRTG
jgi:hypothetical protein